MTNATQTDETANYGEFAEKVANYADADRKGKAAIRAFIDKARETAEDARSDAIDADDLETAKTYTLTVKAAKAAYDACVTKTDLDRTPVNWGERVANRAATLRRAAELVETGQFGLPDDVTVETDNLPEGVIDDELARKVAGRSLGSSGTKGPKHDTKAHIVQSVTEAGEWQSVAQIAKFRSDAYGDDKAGNGAITAALTHQAAKLRKMGVRVEKRTNGGDKAVLGASPITPNPNNRGGRG
jgi:hypothetical protein